MGRIVFVFNNSKTGKNNHYYHKLVRHYEDNMAASQLKDHLGMFLQTSAFILTNEHSMVLDNHRTLYGNKVFCILNHDLFYEMLEKNLIYIGCNGIVDYDSDDLQSEICADIPDLTANLESEEEA
jgi:hypothetical protein